MKKGKGVPGKGPEMSERTSCKREARKSQILKSLLSFVKGFRPYPEGN